MDKRPLVILESPYAGDIDRNIKYARACVRHSILLGEAPIASHLLYTQPGILRDEVMHERELGIAMGLAWLQRADLHVFYTDYGMSRGMTHAEEISKASGVRVEHRCLPPGMLQDPQMDSDT